MLDQPSPFPSDDDVRPQLTVIEGGRTDERPDDEWGDFVRWAIELLERKAAETVSQTVDGARVRAYCLSRAVQMRAAQAVRH